MRYMAKLTSKNLKYESTQSSAFALKPSYQQNVNATGIFSISDKKTVETSTSENQVTLDEWP